MYEVSDRLEAVRHALKLNPDLILMEIGLPRLNGIKAARQIRGVILESRIVFLTQETPAEVVEEACDVGGDAASPAG